MLRNVWCPWAIIGLAGSLWAGPQTAQQRVESVLAQAGYGAADVGVYILECGSDSVVAAVNQDSLFILASVTKLVTGAAAFDYLGAKYVFRTRVYHDGAFDRATGSVGGNVYVRGGGDPGFTAERTWLLVQHLKHLGLRSVGGDVVLDDSFFDTVSSGPGYGDDLSSRAYEAPIGALSTNFNTIAVHAAPGASVGAPVRITDFPRVDGVKIVCTAKTVAATAPSGLNVQTREMDGRTAIMVYGSMGVDDAPRYVYRKAWQTWEHFGWVLSAMLKDCGVSLAGGIRRHAVPDTLVARGPFYTFDSQALCRSIDNMFKYSSNFAADMVFKTLAAEHSGKPGSWEGGAAAATSWWASNGLPGKLSIVNGSGMGDANRLSPSQTVALLEHIRRNKQYAADFASALSVGGVDGTLETRFTRSSLKGAVRAKTGTLNNYGVSNIAGYVTLSGKTYTFAVFVTSRKITQYSSWTTQEKVLEAALGVAR